jgi:hypothetical protein
LPKIQSVVQIDATARGVYEVLTNTAYIIKMFRDAVSVEVDPPGRSVVGQKHRVVARAGRRKFEMNFEVTELVPDRKVVTMQLPGGIFNSFWQCTTLQPRGRKTEARTIFEYELSLGYIGRALNVVLVKKLISENLEAYSKTVKELSELVPLPAPTEAGGLGA